MSCLLSLSVVRSRKPGMKMHLGTSLTLMCAEEIFWPELECAISKWDSYLGSDLGHSSGWLVPQSREKQVKPCWERKVQVVTWETGRGYKHCTSLLLAEPEVAIAVKTFFLSSWQNPTREMSFQKGEWGVSREDHYLLEFQKETKYLFIHSVRQPIFIV